MSALLLMSSVLVVLIVGGMFVYDLMTRRHDVLSWKYLFLAGYIVFFGTGGIFIVLYDVASELHAPSENAKLVLAISNVGFLLLFLLGVRWGLRLRWVDKIIPKLDVPQTTPGVLICLGAMLLVVVGSLAFPATGESFISALASFFRGGLSAASLGLATYWLLTQRFNPISWCVFVGTLGVALVASIVGESGRRGLLGVLMMVPWVWYYTSLRYQTVALWAPKAGAALFLGFALLVGYSSVRATLRTSDRSISDVSQALVESARSADLSRNSLAENLFYQDAAVNTMYIIDSYGTTFPMRPGQGLWWILANPIPRSMWPDKPEALGLEISRQMNVQANLGPGVIGHGWSEAGWFGIIYYALFLGVFYGAGDRLLQARATNPFFVVVMGAGAGQLIAMSRGDTPQFLLIATMTMMAAGAVIMACQIPFRTFMAAFPRLRVGRATIDDSGAEVFEEYGGEQPQPDDATDQQHPEQEWGGDEQDWGQASAAWAYSEHEAEQDRA